MPRGHKSKHRSREKRRQGGEEPFTMKDLLDILMAKEEALSSTSLHLKDAPQRSSAAGSKSTQQECGRDPSPMSDAAAAGGGGGGGAAAAGGGAAAAGGGGGGAAAAAAAAGGAAAAAGGGGGGAAAAAAAAAAGAAAAADVSYTTTNEDTKSQVEERPNASKASVQALLVGILDQMDHRVLMLVNYLLYKYQMNEPITKADMMRNVMKTQKNRFPEILKQASEQLELVFGLDMKEMDPKRNVYVLIDKLEAGDDARVNDSRSIPKTGLLMTILGVIFTKGNSATEEQVWEVLHMMGIREGREHFICGEPKKFISNDLVKGKYLEYRQVANSDPPRYEFLWGPRAFAETSKMKVLEFLAKIHNTVPSNFPALYEEALKDEEERSRARVAARARSTALAGARPKEASKSFSRPK